MGKPRNITVVLDEDLARWVRVWSAEHDLSVSRMIAEMLQAKRQDQAEYQRAMGSYLSRSKKPISKKGPYPKREDLYD